MIFKVEKRCFRKDGELQTTRSYYLRYRLRDMPVDRWKSLGATDLQVANKLAQEFIQEKEREAAGVIEAKPMRDAAQRPLAEHLNDYEADLVTRERAGRGGRGARLLKSRILRLLNDCGWKLSASITADAFIAWRNRQTDSARTLNHYLQGMISFLNWMERGGRIKFNPLKNVAKVDGRGQKKRVRRAFTDDELCKLVQGSGPRGIIYFTAARTGLRWEELRQLAWNEVHLNAPVPHVVVRAETAKNKTEESVCLVPEIVEALRAYRSASESVSNLVFPNGIPRARRLQKDAEALGIAYQDDLGRFADFHSLRYTWATFLQRNGIAQRFAMKLMRHSDIKLTAKVYTDETQLPIYDSIKNLPRLGGCTQIRAQISGAEGQNGAQPVASGEEVKHHESPVNGGDGRALAHCVATSEMERVKGIEPSSQLSPIPPNPFGSGNFYKNCAGNDINSNGLLNQVNNS
jgi:integrase